RHWRMIWFCRSRRIGPPQNGTCANAEVVLAAAGAEQASRKIGHQVVRLDNAPRKILGENHIHAAAYGESKSALRCIAVNLAAAMGRAEENFAERHKVIEAPQVQAGTEQVGL